MTDDLTGGAVSTDGYFAVVLAVTGPVTNTGGASRNYGFGYDMYAYKSVYDFALSPNATKDVDVVRWWFRSSTKSDTYWSPAGRNEGFKNPLSFNIDAKAAPISADFHVAVYGIKA